MSTDDVGEVVGVEEIVHRFIPKTDSTTTTEGFTKSIVIEVTVLHVFRGGVRPDTIGSQLVVVGGGRRRRK